MCTTFHSLASPAPEFKLAASLKQLFPLKVSGVLIVKVNLISLLSKTNKTVLERKSGLIIFRSENFKYACNSSRYFRRKESWRGRMPFHMICFLKVFISFRKALKMTYEYDREHPSRPFLGDTV